MPLNELLERINFDAIGRMKHRMFVVGRFNAKKNGPKHYPELFLFKHPNAVIDPKYQSNFTGVGELSFSSFLDMLKPEVYEITDKQTKRGFAAVRMLPPSQVTAEDRRKHAHYVLNEQNWYIIRSYATTQQDEFAHLQPRIKQRMLALDPTERGREIYCLIRECLDAFSTFQPKAYKIVEAFSDFFGALGGRGSLPAYGAGNALPPGFPQALIDFIYAEDSDSRFTLEGVDVSGDFEDLRGNDDFCSIVSAFRDALLGSEAQQYNHFQGLHSLARTHLRNAPVAEFQEARNAYIQLRQILRGKILISMVLEWALKGLDAIPDLKSLLVERKGAEIKEGEKDRIKGKAITTRWEQNDLAEPVVRADPKERRLFARMLRDSFEFVLDGVLMSPELIVSLHQAREALAKITGEGPVELEAKKELEIKIRTLAAQLPKEVAGLHPEILKVAAQIVGDKAKLGILLGLTDKKFGQGYRKSFVTAVKMLLTDVLCPSLFQEPKFTKDHLRRVFRSDMQTAYVMSVMLDNETKDAASDLGQSKQKEFREYVKDDKIQNKEKLIAELLKDVVGVLTRKELSDRLNEAAEVLSEAWAVLENMAERRKTGRPRISDITTLVPEAVFRRPRGSGSSVVSDAVAKAELQESEVLGVIEAIAQKRAEAAIQIELNKTSQQAQAAGAATEAEEPLESAESEKLIAARVEIKVGAIPKAKLQISGHAAAAYKEKLARDIASAVRNDAEEIHRQAEDRPEKREAEGAVGLLPEREVDLLGAMKSNVKAYQSAMYLIYDRYNLNKDGLGGYRNQVDRFTLGNMMLLAQNELGLGDVHSSLVSMLLDMVLCMDKANPDPLQFWNQKSPTEYFEKHQVDEAGMTALRQMLEVQTQTNLDAMTGFVSEIMGIRHLLEKIKDDNEAEVIVVNSTAGQFMNWLDWDNLNKRSGDAADEGDGPDNPKAKPDNPRERLAPAGLRAGDASVAKMPPGLIYFTDASFDYNHAAKVTFIKGLQALSLAKKQVSGDKGNISIIMPPVCISTGAQNRTWGADDKWYTEGKSLQDAAAGAPCPVYVLGPASFLNSVEDEYKTFIPAGYIFGAHFLSGGDQQLANPSMNEEGVGRFFTLGYNGELMAKSLKRVVWGRDLEDTCSFAADYYLYVLLVTECALAQSGAPVAEQVDWRDYWKYFHNTSDGLVDTTLYDQSEDISESLYGNSLDYDHEPAYHYALCEDVSVAGTPLNCVLLKPPRTGEWMEIEDVQWFNRARTSARLITGKVRKSAERNKKP